MMLNVATIDLFVSGVNSCDWCEDVSVVILAVTTLLSCDTCDGTECTAIARITANH
jgi:hypothetical protein